MNGFQHVRNRDTKIYRKNNSMKIISFVFLLLFKIYLFNQYLISILRKNCAIAPIKLTEADIGIDKMKNAKKYPEALSWIRFYGPPPPPPCKIMWTVPLNIPTPHWWEWHATNKNALYTNFADSCRSKKNSFVIEKR